MSISTNSQDDLLKEEENLSHRISNCKCAHISQYGDASTCCCPICDCNILPCTCSSETCKCQSEEAVINFTTIQLTELIPLTSSIIACVLEETLDYLSLFGKHDISNYKEESDFKISVEEMINREEHCFLYDKERLIPLTKEHPGEVQRFVKMQKDREFIKNTLRKTLTEVQETNKFIYLQEAVYYTLLHRNKEWKILNMIRETQDKFLAFGGMFQGRYKGKGQTIYFTEYEMDRLKYEAEDSVVTHYAQHRFVDKWEKSRVEQNTMTHTKKEEEYKARKQKMYDSCGDDFIVHNNIIKYLRKQIIVLQWRINYLSDNFENMVDYLDSQILNRSEILLELGDKLANLTDVYETRCKKTDHFLKYRSEIVKHRMQVIAATVIQALWRGFHFRKEASDPIKRGTSKKKNKQDSVAKGTKKKSIKKKVQKF